MSGSVTKATAGEEWTIREQLILASAVQRSGDQNWVSVSRAIKPLVETEGRPADYFSQKNCAQQYSAMLDKAGTHKRKRSIEGMEAAETAGQQIVRELTEKYLNYLNITLSKTKDEYISLKKEMEQVESGELDSKLPEMWDEIQKEAAAAKTKTPTSGSSTSKHLQPEQTKPKRKKSPSTTETDGSTTVTLKADIGPAKAASTPAKATATPAKGLMAPALTPAKGEDVPARKVKLEMVPIESAPRVSVSEVPPIIGISSGLELNSKPPMTITIKKEPVPTTPSPMELDSPLPRVVPALTSPSRSSLSPREEKYGLPMHTPHPSPHGGQVTPGEVHVIVQQPNIAALLVEENSKKLPLSSSAPVLSSSDQKSGAPSAVVMSSSVGSTLLPIRTSSTTTVSVLQPSSVASPRTVLTTHTSVATPPVPGRPQVLVEPKRQPEQVAVKIEGQVGVAKAPVPVTSTRVATPPVTTQMGTPLPSAPPTRPSLSVSPLVTSSTAPFPAAAPPTAPPPPVTQPPARPVAPPTIQSFLKPAAPPVPPTSQPLSRPAQASPIVPTTKPQVPGKPAELTKPSRSMESMLQQQPLGSTTSKQSTLLKFGLKKQQQGASQPLKPSSKPEAVTTGGISKPAQQQVTSKPGSSPVVSLSVQSSVSAALSKQVTAAPVTVTSSSVPSTTNQDRLNQDRLNQDRLSQDRLSQDKLSQDSLSQDRLSQDRFSQDRLNQDRLKQDKLSQDRLSQDKLSQDRPTDPRIRTQPSPQTSAAPHTSAVPHRLAVPQTSVPPPLPPPPTVTAAVVAPPPAPPTSKPSVAMETTPTVSPSTTPTSSAPPITTPLAAVMKEEEPAAVTKQVTQTKKDMTSATLPSTPSLETESGEDKVSPSPLPASPVLDTPTRSISTDSKLTTPGSEAPDSKTTSPVAKGMEQGGSGSKGGDKEEDMEDEETPVKPTRKSLKKQWNIRSRKRKAPFEEGHSVESTDTEDDINLSSQHTSAVSSPAPSQSVEDQENLQSHKQWKKAIIIVWRHAAQHKYANLFLHPVREEDAPGYKNVILRPMDLSTIKKKIDSGLIKTDMEFQRDMLLMFQNAFMYNSTEHEVYYMAQEMKNDVMENIQAYLATQAQLQLMEDTTPSKTLRSREGRVRDLHEDSLFSPAKKRRTRADNYD